MDEAFVQRFQQGYLKVLEEQVDQILPGKKFLISQEIERLSPAIYEEHRSWLVDPPSGRHLFMTSLVLAAYRAIAKEKANDDAVINILKYVYLESTRRLTPVDQVINDILQNAPDPFRALVNFTKEIIEPNYGITFCFKHERDDDDFFFSNVTKCFYHDFFAAQHLGQLTQTFCNADKIWMDVLADGRFGVRAERPTTLGYNDDCCRFQFFRVVK